jgi:uncharacterized protein YndB with AHSA1/START domain
MRQVVAGVTPVDIGSVGRLPQKRGNNKAESLRDTSPAECSFRGTYLEVEPSTRTVETWLFDDWPDAHAVEAVDLHETDGLTKLTMTLAFRDQAGRDHMIWSRLASMPSMPHSSVAAVTARGFGLHRD